MVTVRTRVRDTSGNWLSRAEERLNSRLAEYGLETTGKPTIISTDDDGTMHLDWPVENR